MNRSHGVTQGLLINAFSIVAPADCERAFNRLQPPERDRALPVTATTWQRIYAGNLPAQASPWWMDVQADSVQAQSFLWVPPDLPCFAGHFPDQPILPGVMQLEWAVQLASILWPQQAAANRFAGTVRVKFKAPVLPNGVLSLTLHKTPTSISMTLRSATEALTSARLLYRD